MAGLAGSVEVMDAETFFRFAETRPDEEKWELFDGVPVMNPTPVYPHQAIVRNLLRILGNLEIERNAAWTVIPGIAVRVSETSVPVPDVMILPRRRDDAHVCDDMIAAFEVLSPSTRKRDLDWKRKAYAGLLSVLHYVIIAPGKVEILHDQRSKAWAELKLQDMRDALFIPELAIELKLANIYYDTRPWHAATG